MEMDLSCLTPNPAPAPLAAKPLPGLELFCSEPNTTDFALAGAFLPPESFRERHLHKGITWKLFGALQLPGTSPGTSPGTFPAQL